MDESTKKEKWTKEKEILKHRAATVHGLEAGRPEYEKDKAESINNFITWTFNLLNEYQVYDNYLQRGLVDYPEFFGAQLPAAREELDRIRKEKLNIIRDQQNAAEDLDLLQAKIKRQQKELEEQQKREEQKHTPELTPAPVLSEYGLMNDRLNKKYLDTEPQLKAVDGIQYLTWAVNQAGKQQDPVLTSFMLSLGGSEKITASDRLDAEDENIILAVANIIYKLAEDGIPGPWRITPEEIWRAKKGLIGQHTDPPEKEEEDICRRIDKMRLMNVTIDVAEELNSNYFSDKNLTNDLIVDGKMEDNCIHATKGHAKTKRGRIVDVYIFYAIPIIYNYNRAKGHIVLVDYSLLDTSDTTKNDKDNLTDTFKLYLLREILQMYTGYRKSTKIYFETMYTATGAKTPEERARESKHAEGMTKEAILKSQKSEKTRISKNDREKVEKLLKSWESDSRKPKFISSHDLIKDGKKIIGIDVNLNPKFKKTLEQKQVTKKY